MSMFCFQCQETMHNQGCTERGVCGKSAEIANLQDELLRRLKELAVVYLNDGGNLEKLGRFTVDSLFMTITNANFDGSALQQRIAEAIELLNGRHEEVMPGVLATDDPDIRSLRELLIYGVKGLSAYTSHAAVLGMEDLAIYAFVLQALAATTQDLAKDKLLSLVIQCGDTAAEAMKLLDNANFDYFGATQITSVATGVGTNPGILVSGHDLLDLYELLEQTRNLNIDIYTHSEMLPAHYYPKLKQFKHLRSNYGNAWHKQAVEFEKFNGPILMTTNCIVPIKESYRQRIFTTGQAGYPGVRHIPERHSGCMKDFSPLIELAKRCKPPELLDDTQIVGGFGHRQIKALLPQIIEAVKSGAIKRFIVMAGCDGRQPSRNYYTHVAEKLPPDTVILTAGCAKYRYNKLNLGDINGIPRVLDAGQCNDSYSLAVAAIMLKEAFKLADINDLPLSFNIAWYEQKAVAVLLALLALGFKDIRLGPTLPAFISPNVLTILVKEFNVKVITTPEVDIEQMLAGN